MLSRLPLISKLNVPKSRKCWGSCCSPAVGHFALGLQRENSERCHSHTASWGRRRAGEEGALRTQDAGRVGLRVPGRKPPQGWEGPGQAVQEGPCPVGPGPGGPEHERGRKAARVRPGWLGHQGLPPPGGSWSSQGSSPRLWLVSMGAAPAPPSSCPSSRVQRAARDPTLRARLALDPGAGPLRASQPRGSGRGQGWPDRVRLALGQDGKGSRARQ